MAIVLRWYVRCKLPPLITLLCPASYSAELRFAKTCLVRQKGLVSLGPSLSAAGANRPLTTEFLPEWVPLSGLNCPVEHKENAP